MRDSIFKPCPFCGGKAELRLECEGFLGGILYSVVTCTKCGAKGERFMQSPLIASNDEATNAWNRRATNE